MTEVAVRAGHEQEDIQSAKQSLVDHLAESEKVLMITRGTSDDIAVFAGKVAGRNNGIPWRSALWLRVSDADLRQILSNGQFDAWFDGHDAMCAVVLDGQRNVSSRLDSQASTFAIDNAFLNAKS